MKNFMNIPYILNNKIHKILKQKNTIVSFFAIVTITFGMFGYLLDGQNIFEAFTNAIRMFGLNFPESFTDSKQSNFLLAIASLSAIITLFLLAAIVFFKNYVERKLLKNIFNSKHNIVFGLGAINRSFLNSFNLSNEEDQKKIQKIVIIESDANNQYLEEYKEKGFGVFVANVFNEKTIESLQLENLENAIISLGEDKRNIELAKQLIEKLPKSNAETKLIIHIENKNLETLFHSSFLQSDKQINIKTFSFYDEVAKNLFKNHFIDGDSLEYVNSDKEFKTIILGDGLLLEKVLYQMALISHLPNENKHTVYMIDNSADELFIKIKKALHYKEEPNSFPTFEIKPIQLDQESLEFFSNDIWHMDDLVNVIVAFDEEKRNLDTAMELYDRVYLEKAVNNKKMPKILFGVYDEQLLIKSINKNDCEFKNFYTFGCTNEILSYEELIDEETDILGKLVNYTYDGFLNGNDSYDEKRLLNYKTNDDNKNKINKKWFDYASYADKSSSIAQAKLIDYKLKSLGLKKIPSKKSLDELLKMNREIFNSKLDKKYDGSYHFPEEFNSTIFNKLTRMEHNRWNDFHFLNGWKYSKDKAKKVKLHNCLIPIVKFESVDMKKTIFYDICSFMYIPNYLAEAGYEIISYDYVYIYKVGITGHRKNLDIISDEILKKAFEYIQDKEPTHIISPLAEGADRIVAKYCMDVFDAKLEVPIPFKLSEYEKDFLPNYPDVKDSDSKKEFHRILGCTKPLELSSYENDNKQKVIYDEPRNNLYKQCGEYVVNNSDILITIWDGQKSNGTGGTADIVKYAMKKLKPIIHINPHTLKIEKINF